MTNNFNAEQAKKNASLAHFDYEKIINEILHSTEVSSKIGKKSATFQYQKHTLGANGVIPIEAELIKRGFHFEASERDEVVTIIVSF